MNTREFSAVAAPTLTWIGAERDGDGFALLLFSGAVARHHDDVVLLSERETGDVD